jgi:hypothetical protein
MIVRTSLAQVKAHQTGKFKALGLAL